jgi:hypothetical protein
MAYQNQSDHDFIILSNPVLPIARNLECNEKLNIKASIIKREIGDGDLWMIRC